jgi:hypothetical protein
MCWQTLPKRVENHRDTRGDLMTLSQRDHADLHDLMVPDMILTEQDRLRTEARHKVEAVLQLLMIRAAKITLIHRQMILMKLQTILPTRKNPMMKKMSTRQMGAKKPILTKRRNCWVHLGSIYCGPPRTPRTHYVPHNLLLLNSTKLVDAPSNATSGASHATSTRPIPSHATPACRKPSPSP